MIPANAQGLDCDRAEPGCAVPTNTPIRLRFDRPIRPSTAVRQSISFFVSKQAAYAPFLSPSYDLFTRSVSFHMSGTFLPSVLYQVRLPIPAKNGDAGFRAFDGAPLADGEVLTASSFFTADGPKASSGDVAPFAEPQCSDVVAVLASTCASSCCHGGTAPAMGLRLDSAEGLLDTAVMRVAHQTETGSGFGTASAEPARFGVGMRLVEPNQSYSSYLIYKLLLNAQNHAPCTGDCAFSALPGAADCLPLSDAERDHMAGWFVQGEPMPMSAVAASALGCSELPPRATLDCGSMRAIARWIDSGATCP